MILMLERKQHVVLYYFQIYLTGYYLKMQFLYQWSIGVFLKIVVRIISTSDFAFDFCYSFKINVIVLIILPYPYSLGLELEKSGTTFHSLHFSHFSSLSLSFSFVLNIRVE